MDYCYYFEYASSICFRGCVDSVCGFATTCSKYTLSTVLLSVLGLGYYNDDGGHIITSLTMDLGTILYYLCNYFCHNNDYYNYYYYYYHYYYY